MTRHVTRASRCISCARDEDEEGERDEADQIGEDLRRVRVRVRVRG